MPTNSVEVVITATDLASGAIEKFGSILSTGLVGAAAAAGAALVGLVGVALKSGAEIGAAFHEIEIHTGATGDALDELKDRFADVFANVPSDAKDVAGVLSLVSERTHATGITLNDLTQNLLEVSHMMGTDATASAQLFTRVLGDWGVQNKDSVGTLDMLFKASQTTGVGIDDLMSKIVYFGAPMRNFGFTVSEAVAIFSKFQAEGVNSTTVMTSLRIAAGKLADSGKPLKTALADVFKEIKDAKDLPTALSIGFEIFGKRAGSDMVAAIREGRFAIADLEASLKASGGAVEQTTEDTRTLGEVWDIAWHNIELAMFPAGTAILGFAKGILLEALPAVRELSGVVSNDLQVAIKWLNDTAVPYVQNLWNAFKEGGLGGVGAKLGADLSGLWTNTIWPTISKWAADFWTWVTGPGGVLETLTPQLNKFADGILVWALSKDTITKMESVGDTVAGAIVGTITSPVQGTTAMGGFAGALTKAGSALAGTFALVGVEVGKGLVDGIVKRIEDPDTKARIGGALNSMIVSVNNSLNPFHFAIEWLQSHISGYAEGGIVPGPLGSPQLAIVHGGETITPAGVTNNWNYSPTYQGAPSNPSQDFQMMRSFAGVR
jgi:TP901 family phage tail tape measure protein